MITLYILLGALAVLAAVLLVRTARFTKAPPTAQPPRDVSDRIDAQLPADRLLALIRCKTVADPDPGKIDRSQFEKLHALLREFYPLVHQTMEREQINGYNLLYRWRGTDPDRRPIALLSHLDVVPAVNEADWTYPPFEGHDDGEMIWGRGATDMKNQLVMVLEACERLIAQGYTPKQDVYLCFGQNEEIGDVPAGTGADGLAALLEQRGLRFDCVIDEGGCITDGEENGVPGKLCIIGAAEKGYATIRLTSRSAGGHSSRPPRTTALGRVCAAAVQVEKHPMKPMLIPPVEEMLRATAPYMRSFTMRLFAANLWLFRPLLLRVAARSDAFRAGVSTTFAVTQAEGSRRDNILPQDPVIGVNCRILPGQTLQQALDHVRRVVRDPAVEVSYSYAHQVDRISPTDTRAFAKLGELVQRYYPGTVICPYIQFGASDARNYYRVTDNVYRIMPVYLPAELANLAHGTDERIHKKTLASGIALLMDFLSEYDGE